jgi:hypothetical protein
VEANLLTHRIASLIQEFAHPEYQEAVGLTRIVAALNSGLAKVNTDVTRAGMSDYRKFYHEAWKDVVAELCPATYRDVLDDKYRQLVF